MIIILIFLSILLSGCNTSSDKEYGENFSFTLLNGQEKHSSDYAGKVVLLDFTGVNCPYCVPQTFVLEEIYNQYGNADLEIISLYIWMNWPYMETVGDIIDLIEAYRCSLGSDAKNKVSQADSIKYLKEISGKQNGIELNWVIGYDDSEGTLYNKYGQNGVPYLLILDKNGNIYYSSIGYTGYYSLTEKLDELIS